MPSDSPTAVGVDLGGTWLRLVALNSRGQSIARHCFAACPCSQLPRHLKREFKRLNWHPRYLGVSSRGVWKSEKRRLLTRQLAGLATKILVLPDVTAAWLAAFQPRSSPSEIPPHRPFLKGGEPRIILIAGTGSIALRRDSLGRWCRAGGLGPEKGDEGSAYWIGRRWLRLRNKTAGTSVRSIAAVTREVLKRRRRGDVAAQGLMAEAQDHLAKLAASLLIPGRKTQVAIAGGLAQHPEFSRGLRLRLRRRALALRAPLRFARLRCDAATAAARAIMGRVANPSSPHR